MKLSAVAPGRLRRQGAFLALVTIALLVVGALPAYASDAAHQSWGGLIEGHLHDGLHWDFYFWANGTEKKQGKFVVNEIPSAAVTVKEQCTFEGSTVEHTTQLNFNVHNSPMIPVDPDGLFEGSSSTGGSGDYDMTIKGQFTKKVDGEDTNTNLNPTEASGTVRVPPWTIPHSWKCHIVGGPTIRWEAKPLEPPKHLKLGD